MNNILLQAAAAPAGQNGWSSILMIVLMFVVIYFFMIRPQQKRQKEIKKFRESIKTGDKVITAGGIYGKVKDVKETTITLEIADNVRITIDKNSVYANAVDSNSAAEAKA
jgi:preprotein translocase subunit YajC